MGSVHAAARRFWKAIALGAASWLALCAVAGADTRVAADLNGDGRADQVVVVGGAGSQTLRLTFAGGAVTFLGTPRPVRDLIAGDLDFDGDIDLLAATEGSEIIAWLNRGRGRFEQPRLPATPRRAPPGPILSTSRNRAADTWSLGTDAGSAIPRPPLVPTPVARRAALCYANPVPNAYATAPSRPRGPPFV